MTDFDTARRAMVDCQIRPSDVTRYTLIDAMLRIPREQFVPRSKREVAYSEAEVEIAPGRSLLAPRIFAKMVEASEIKSTDLILELCPGTGYSTAILAALGEMVVSIEADETLSAQAQGLLEGLGINNAIVTNGDPIVGDSAHGPFDLIFLNGCVELVPTALTDQLKEGGRLVALVQDGSTSSCQVFTRSGTAVSQRFVFDGYGPMLEGFSAEQEFTL